MQLTERHIFTGNKAMESLCHRAGLLHNYVNYYVKQSVLEYVEKFTEYEFSGLCAEFDQFDFRNLPSNCSQQIIRLVFQNWRGFFASMRAWGKDKTKFSGRPQYPSYKKGEKLHVLIFTKYQIRLKNGYIHFPKATELAPIKVQHENIQQVRLVPQTNCIVVEVIYEQEIVQADVDQSLFLSIDMGVNNLATGISNTGDVPFIINGKPLKSINQYYNKERARLQYELAQNNIHAKEKKYTSPRLKKLTFTRNNRVENYMHQTSRYIVDYCVKNKIATIVIGKNDGWKQDAKLGTKTNQSFVNIPHAKLIQKIEYKAMLVGIKVIKQEEAHTSKCDHLAGESIEHHDKYLGNRKCRGLFQSSTGKLVNGDVNGAIGIALKSKVADDSFVRGIVSRGAAFAPRKVCLPF